MIMYILRILLNKNTDYFSFRIFNNKTARFFTLQRRDLDFKLTVKNRMFFRCFKHL